MSMIKRDDLPASPTASNPMTPPPGSSDLLLGAGAEFEGKLTFRGTVRIDALFKGSIVTNDVLVVGEHARIDAEITCGTVIVDGEVNGDIHAKTAVEVRRAGKVRGNVDCPSIVVEKGALMHGSVKMTSGEKPAAVKPTPAPPAK